MFNKQTLENGLRIINIPLKDSKTVTVLVAVGAGSKYENKKDSGVSHFLEHMFFKGTKKRPNTLAIAETLDRVGGEYNAFTGQEYTGYWAKVDYRHLDLALDWVSDIFQNSLFPKQTIEQEKSVVIEEAKMYQDTPVEHIGEVFEKLLYGDQPAGRQIIGSINTIKKFSREQLVDYWQNHYSAKNTVICLAGNFDLSKKQIKKKVLDYFNKLNTSDVKGKPSVRTKKQAKPNVLIKHKKTDQTHFCLGVPGYDLFHKDRYVLSVLTALLGGMMSSRIFINVRVKHGLAYYVNTHAEKQTDTGYLVTQAGVDHSKLNKAVELILQEYNKLTQEKVGAQELNKAKEYIKGKLMLNLEGSDDWASWSAGQEILQNKILSLGQICKKIDQVSSDDILHVAKDIFQESKLNLAVIGPKKLKVNQNLCLNC